MHISKPQYLAFSKGKLITKETYCQTQFQHEALYSHTIRETPDEYHINAIKQYRKEIDEIRRSYQQLRRAYYYLLGYRAEGDDRVPKVTFYRDKNQLCVTQGSECNERTSSMNASVIQLSQNIADIEENKKKIDRVTDSLTESIIQFRISSLLKPSTGDQKLTKSTKIKTEYDQQNEGELQLYEALKQNRKLRQVLQTTRLTTEAETRQIKQSYQEHIRKLEQILQRERRHTKMLNGVITRTRIELTTKDNFIKESMKMKAIDKTTLDRVLKQMKLKS